MTSSVEVHRAAHEAFNARDWDRMRELVADSLTFTDRPRGIEMRSVDEFLGRLNEWTTGMSDAKVGEPRYLEAGDHSVCRFVGSGTNDGPIGPPRAVTGKRMEMPFCELLRVRDGKVVEGEMYYDQLTMLTQLGLAEAPVTA
jgi:ketosteroid isomerase-like protein